MSRAEIEQAKYFVMWRSGGTHYAIWTRLFDRYTLVEARKKQDELMRMGYTALVQSAEQFSKLGMPVGWDWRSVDWGADEIKRECDRSGLEVRTVHIKREVAA